MANLQKILVTGANGQLGMELRQLASLYTGFEFIFVSHEDLPVDQADQVNVFFEIHRPHYCINCAAYTAVDKAETEKKEAFRVNAEGAGILAAACEKTNCRLIHISTDYVFDGRSRIPYKEDEITNPQNVYGASKLEGERLIQQTNPGAIIIRTSWVYSYYGKNFVKTILKLIREKDELNVVNDQFGSPTSAADLAASILQIISSETWVPGIYHFCNEGTISWYDFALAIKEISGSSCNIHPISTSQYPTPAHRPVYSSLSTDKIRNTFGIQIPGWKESLTTCLRKISAG